jgi:hypothetical protein
MKSRFVPLLILLAGLLLQGCMYSPVGFSASTIPLRHNEYERMVATSGSSTITYLFNVFPLNSLNPLEAAQADALLNSGGDALIDVTADKRSINLLLVKIDTTTVKGMAVQVRR